MKRYIPRAFWYFGLILITLGVLMLPLPRVPGALLSAALTYLPLSLTWIVMNGLLFGVFQLEHRKIFGLDDEWLGLWIMALGAALSTAAFFWLSNAWLSGFLLMIFVGADTVLAAREWKAKLSQ